MSEFREQLESAKAGYRDARYPGDVVADVLGATDASDAERSTRSSELRTQLDAARIGYRDARYAGDLAADVLGVAASRNSHLAPRNPLDPHAEDTHARRRRWRIALAAAAGVAAALAAVITIVAVLHRPTGPGVIAPVEQEVAINFAMPGRPEMPERPDMPGGLAIAPGVYVGTEDVGGMPEMPSRFEVAANIEHD